MGMSLVYHRLTPLQRTQLERSPEFAGKLFSSIPPPPMPPEVLARAKQSAAKAGLMKRLMIWFMMRRMNDPRVLSLDKSWHVVHFVLTGDKRMAPFHSKENPLHNVVMGGHAIGIDGTYGPIRVIENNDAKTIATALTLVNIDTLRSKYTLAEINSANLYSTPAPGGWSARDLDIVFACFPRLQVFFADAARSGEDVGLAML